ncbi:MAG: DUF1579 domain-containing protein [Planctomycetota bacterium]
MKLTQAFSLAVAILFVLAPTLIHAQAIATEEHKILHHDVGTWDATVKMWMEPGAEEPMVSRGVETNRMVGDFWLVGDFEGDFQGMPMIGHSMQGYDAESGKFFGMWVDSMSDKPTKMSGTWDAESSTMSFETSAYDPTGAPISGKMVIVYNEDGSRTMSMHYPNPENTEEWMTVMEIHYTPRDDSDGSP